MINDNIYDSLYDNITRNSNMTLAEIANNIANQNAYINPMPTISPNLSTTRYSLTIPQMKSISVPNKPIGHKLLKSIMETSHFKQYPTCYIDFNIENLYDIMYNHGLFELLAKDYRIDSYFKSYKANDINVDKFRSVCTPLGFDLSYFNYAKDGFTQSCKNTNLHIKHKELKAIEDSFTPEEYHLYKSSYIKCYYVKESNSNNYTLFFEQRLTIHLESINDYNHRYVDYINYLKHIMATIHLALYVNECGYKDSLYQKHLLLAAESITYIGLDIKLNLHSNTAFLQKSAKSPKQLSGLTFTF